MSSAVEVANNFVQFYYQTFDTQRAQLAALYQPQSMLTFEGEQFQGTENILNKLTSLPFQRVQHRIVTCDAQPSPAAGGLLITITGQLLVDDESKPLNFSQTFQLLTTGVPGGYYVFNDLFRLNYG